MKIIPLTLSLEQLKELCKYKVTELSLKENSLTIRIKVVA